MNTATQLKDDIPISQICSALDLPRATFYRKIKPAEHEVQQAGEWGYAPHQPGRLSTLERKTHPRALSEEERAKIIDLLHGTRFVDKSPAHVYATLLDEGTYICSERTMYRLLAGRDEVRERRDIVCHGNYKKPELLATAPNQVWSWDITKLHGPEKWQYFYLYVILDIFSRCVVGWLVANRESGALAKTLIEDTVEKQNVTPGQLIIHSDRGGPMKSKPVAFLMADLGVTKSHSRPHVSDDNPFSEAQFKTLKYCPQFPEKFGCIEDAISFCRNFFRWYNGEHKHSGIGYYSPEDVHLGRASDMERARNTTLREAFEKNPNRFVNGAPEAHSVPKAVWINPPKEEVTTDGLKCS